MTQPADGISDASRALDAVLEDIRRKGNLTDAHLVDLHLLFGRHLSKALQIVDRRGVFLFSGEHSDREAWHVSGRTASDHYLVLPGSYCTCRAFSFESATHGVTGPCKHQLAAAIAQALGRVRARKVPDVVLAEMLSAPA